MEPSATSSERLSEAELYDRWAARWERFINTFDAEVAPSTIPELLRDKIKNGNAERAIAGGHEGREILELLQNARDAIPRDAERGRVYIGVYDEGVLVANTGTPFDMFDEDVEDAVTMIGESAKEDSDDEIGHKGVGLKSILSTGEAFEIWSQHPTASEETLRVRLSRAYITRALLASLGYETQSIDRHGPIADQTIAEFGQTAVSTERDDPLDIDAREAIGKLPLFDFPVPLAPAAGTDDAVADKAANLISGDTDEWYGDAFRTAVFIDYEDDAWQELLDAFDIPHPDEPERSPAERAEQLWSYLASDGDDHGLTSETIVQLGAIDTLLLERTGGEIGRARERWAIDRSSDSLQNTRITHETVEVSRTAEGEPFITEVFDEFQFEDPDSDVQLLVPQNVGHRDRPPAYPLYLYYPIENTRDIELPYSLHGHFIVETNRKDLSLNSLDTNQAVLERGIDLIGEVASAAVTHDLGDQYPWILLPPAPDTAPESPTTKENILPWLQSEVFAELRDRACIPTVGTAESESVPTAPDDTLLHWDPTIRAGFRALYEVRDASSITGPFTDDGIRFPTQATLTGCQRLPADWTSRIRTLLAVADPEAFTATVATSWARVLSQTVAQSADDSAPPHLECGADTARNLFTGTIEAILGSGSDDDTLRSLLTDRLAELETVYLLPCQYNESAGTEDDATPTEQPDSDDESDDTLLLIPIEPRSGPSPEQRGIDRSRSVIWDVTSPERDLETPDVPSANSSYRVYFFDEQTEQNERVRRVLDLAGRPWGVRRYDGAPSYFRELLDTFATTDRDTVATLDFYFLANQVTKLGGESSDLQTHEGAFLPLSYVESAVATADGDQRQNLRRRINLRQNQLSLIRDGGTHSIDTTTLGDDWQRILAQALGTNDSDDWGSYDADPFAVWPGPETEPWTVVAGALDGDSATERIAETLGLFGASVLPGIRCVWMYGAGHPRPRRGAAWDPTEWTPDDFRSVASLPPDTTALQTALTEAADAYRSWITAPGRHPQTTAEHSNKCNVKTDGVLEQVYLATWTWLDDPSVIAALGEDDLLELLRRYADEFQDSILRTGWACSNGHQRDGYGWHSTVPTLLNWQLRHLPVWETFLTTDSDLAPRWHDDTDRLAYAVLKTGSRGARPARLFPHVEADELSVSTDLLDTLGVKPIDAFDVTEAAWHLQRLLDVLAVDSLSEPSDGVDNDGFPDGSPGTVQDPVPIDVPDDRLNDWNAAYTDLLTPILQHLPDDEATMADLELPFLTHLPIKIEGDWRAASLAWLEAHASEGRYYEEQSPKPWERREVEEGNHWLLPQTRSGPFRRLTDALGIERVDASKPVFEAADLSFTDASLTDLRTHLRERRSLLIASLEQTSEDRIREFAQELDDAIAELRVAETFPQGPAFEGLIDPQSGLYAPRENAEAFVLNAEAFDDGPTLDGLATAVGLLAEQPTKVPTFREVLSTDLTTRELEARWRRTFPLDDVERILGTQRRQRLYEQLTALIALFERLDEPLAISADAVLEDLDDDAQYDAFARALAQADTTQLDIDEPSQAVAFIDAVHARLPDALAFVLDRVFGANREPWPTLLATARTDDPTEALVIDWLAEHASALDATSCFPQQVRLMYDRTLTIWTVWTHTADEELADPDTWRTRVADLDTENATEWTAVLPPELQSDAITGDRLFYYSGEFRSAVVTPLLDTLTTDLPDSDSAIESVLRQYITEGTFPVASESTSAADHQDTALADLQARDAVSFTSAELLSETFTVGNASPRTSDSGGGGGGSTQYQGRGQQAEAATLVAILNDAATWLADEPKGMVRSFRSMFRRLQTETENTEYQWHVDRVWEQQLLPLLSNDGLTREDITNWQDSLSGHQRLRDHPLVRLCNVALERGPGFDVIDPFGPLAASSTSGGSVSSQAARAAPAFDQFLPVEVKAVDGTSPPFDFRLTTNEYKQAKAFVRGDRSYAIRLVYVPPVDDPDWAQQTTVVSEIVLDDVASADALVRDQPFEELVKGGYMNLRLSD